MNLHIGAMAASSLSGWSLEWPASTDTQGSTAPSDNVLMRARPGSSHAPAAPALALQDAPSTTVTQSGGGMEDLSDAESLLLLRIEGLKAETEIQRLEKARVEAQTQLIEVRRQLSSASESGRPPRRPLSRPKTKTKVGTEAIEPYGAVRKGRSPKPASPVQKRSVSPPYSPPAKVKALANIRAQATATSPAYVPSSPERFDIGGSDSDKQDPTAASSTSPNPPAVMRTSAIPLPAPAVEKKKVETKDAVPEMPKKVEKAGAVMPRIKASRATSKSPRRPSPVRLGNDDFDSLAKMVFSSPRQTISVQIQKATPEPVAAAPGIPMQDMVPPPAMTVEPPTAQVGTASSAGVGSDAMMVEIPPPPPPHALTAPPVVGAPIPPPPGSSHAPAPIEDVDMLMLGSSPAPQVALQATLDGGMVPLVGSQHPHAADNRQHVQDLYDLFQRRLDEQTDEIRRAAVAAVQAHATQARNDIEAASYRAERAERDADRARSSSANRLNALKQQAAQATVQLAATAERARTEALAARRDAEVTEAVHRGRAEEAAQWAREEELATVQAANLQIQSYTDAANMHVQKRDMVQREQFIREELALRRRAETVIAMSEQRALEVHRDALVRSELAADREGRAVGEVQRIQDEASQVCDLQVQRARLLEEELSTLRIQHDRFVQQTQRRTEILEKELHAARMRAARAGTPPSQLGPGDDCEKRVADAVDKHSKELEALRKEFEETRKRDSVAHKATLEALQAKMAADNATLRTELEELRKKSSSPRLAGGGAVMPPAVADRVSAAVVASATPLITAEAPVLRKQRARSSSPTPAHSSLKGTQKPRVTVTSTGASSSNAPPTGGARGGGGGGGDDPAPATVAARRSRSERPPPRKTLGGGGGGPPSDPGDYDDDRGSR